MINQEKGKVKEKNTQIPNLSSLADHIRSRRLWSQDRQLFWEEKTPP